MFAKPLKSHLHTTNTVAVVGDLRKSSSTTTMDSCFDPAQATAHHYHLECLSALANLWASTMLSDLKNGVILFGQTFSLSPRWWRSMNYTSCSPLLGCPLYSL